MGKGMSIADLNEMPDLVDMMAVTPRSLGADLFDESDVPMATPGPVVEVPVSDVASEVAPGCEAA